MGELRRRAEEHSSAPSLIDALRKSDVAIIAEVKRSSPSKGMINPGIDVENQVRAYEGGGAAAISILTEPKRFGGSNDDLLKARSATRLPLLKKDFHVDVAQILEAKTLGASAALVIVRAVEPAALRDLLDAGNDIGLEILVEVRDEAELELALIYQARLIGVNNRNLETLEIDPGTATRLVPFIPSGVVAVAESGVKSADDVRRLADAGADAVLVGSELSASTDPESAVWSLARIARNQSARKG
jgi:indole-3-glycerol phosphate synthase